MKRIFCRSRTFLPLFKEFAGRKMAGKKMIGNDWPPLVPYRPGEEEKLPGIVPKIPSKDEDRRWKASQDKAKENVARLEAASLTSAHNQLEKLGLQPVPVKSEHLCQDEPKMKVMEGDLDWDLMKVAVPRGKGRLVEGINKNDKALDGPHPSSILCTGSQPGVQKTVITVRKRGKKKMTPAKKKQLENRTIFCGPIKKKTKRKRTKKAKKPKVDQKDGDGAGVSPEVYLKRFLFLISVDLTSQERPVSHSSGGKQPRKVPQTLDLSAEVIR